MRMVLGADLCEKKLFIKYPRHLNTATLIFKSRKYTLSIPEAGETAEAPVKRYCNTG